MPVLAKGGNAAVSTSTTAVAVTCGPGVGIDVAALLVTADGRVRSDDDLVFFNNPSVEGGAVVHSAAPGGDVVRVELGRLPAAVDRIVVTASVDAAAPGRTFADVSGLSATVTPGSGEALEFTPPRSWTGRPPPSWSSCTGGATGGRRGRSGRGTRPGWRASQRTSG